MEVLLVEDNQELSLFIKKGLEKYGHRVMVSDSIANFVSGKSNLCFDVVVLDLILNGESGEDLVIYVRKKGINVPILVLSSLADVRNKVDLLKLGADDYMTKPFDIEELSARMESLYRRYLDFSVEDEEKFGDIVFYWKQNRMLREGRNILLTKKEGDLMRLLVRNKGKSVRSEDILKKIWNVDSGYHSNVLQSMIRRLRKKVDGNYGNKIIKNIHGVGYLLDLPNGRSLSE